MLRKLVKALLGPSLWYALLTQRYQRRALSTADFVRWNAMLADAWLRNRLNRRAYSLLDEAQVRAARTSDTVFVFGSGYSLNDITPPEWAAFQEHDIFGFNAFYNEKWAPVGFHLLRGGIYGELRWRPYAEEVARALRSSPLYESTIFLMQEELLGQFPNQLVGYRLLPGGARLFRYRTARGPGLPTRSFREGIRHVTGTLDDAVNCAYCLGWKEIVLVGVDLYDNRYFWLGPNETLAYDRSSATVVPAEVNNVRGLRYDEPHNTVRNGVVEQMGQWGELLEGEGVRLCVYNPRSLLARVLPVYGRLSQVSGTSSRTART